MLKTVVINDLQIPFVDEAVLDLVLGFIDDIQPNGVVLNGDVVDCYSIGGFAKNPLTDAQLTREISEAEAVMERLSVIENKVWIGGNHEDRLRRFVWNHAPQFAGLDVASFPRLFHLADYGFDWIDYGDFYTIGKLLVTHGDLVRQDSGATARAHFAKFGRSLLIGHTHRMGAYYKTRLGKPYVAYENGCLCSLKPEWTKHPDWQQGFSVVHHETDGAFYVQQIPIFRRNGKPTFFYGEELWHA